MDWQRYFPTYYRWFKHLRDSTVWRLKPVGIVRDAWQGVERRCVLEIGRGKRCISHWQFNLGETKKIHYAECDASDIESLTIRLSEDLQSTHALGLSCDIVLQPPWAVAKVFSLTTEEAEAPDRWLIQHRKKVFPRGIEDDISLTLRVFRSDTGKNRVVVGLIRKSVVKLITTALNTAGSTVNQVIIGPLLSLENMASNSHLVNAILLDKSSSESTGCWLLQDGLVAGWTEIIHYGNSQSQLMEQLPTYFGESIDDMQPAPEVVEVPRYCPEFEPGNLSRWKFPSFQWEIPLAGLISSPRRLIEPKVQALSFWLFRWGVILAIAAVLFAITGHLFKATAAIIHKPSSRESADWETHRERLMTERELLRLRFATIDGKIGQNIMPVHLWHALGEAKTDSIWLRAVTLQNGKGKVGVWVVDGLSVGRNHPYTFTTNLSEQSMWNARVIRLEAIDTQRAKQIPTKIKKNIVRFTIEVTR